MICRITYCLLPLLLANYMLLSQRCSDSLATPETKNLYKNLFRLGGKHVLFGHQDDPCYGVNWKYIPGNSDVRLVTGQYPAVYGFDLGRIELAQEFNLDSVPFDKMHIYIKQAYERGGIITLSWHLNNPLTGGSAWDNKPGAVTSVLPGGEKNILYNGWLDKVANFLSTLKTSDHQPIPVILRLFHELNGSWFWWGQKQCSPDEMKQLWRYTIHYLRDTRKLHQILYAFNTDKFNSTREYQERYPGDDIIDILGFDIYQAHDLKSDSAFRKFLENDLSMLDSLASVHSKIPALTEFGYVEIPDSAWWTNLFLPVLKQHRAVYALAWRNAGKKQDGNAEYYVPYPGAVSAPDFKRMAASPFILFENGIQSKNIYQ